MKSTISIFAMSIVFAAACTKSTTTPPASTPEPSASEPSTTAAASLPSTEEQAAITSGVTQLSPAVNACYAAAAAASPDVKAGQLRLKIAVGAQGAVTTVDVMDALHPDVDACAVKAAMATTFSRGDFTFAVPFTLGATP